MEEFFKIIFRKELYLPLVYVIVGIIVYGIIKKLIRHIFSIKKYPNQNEKRTKTVQNLLENIMRYTIIFLVILSILTVFGIDIQAILAGLGIVGLVLGLALQDIIKDFLSGISIILENQYAIGDTIEVNGFMGEVIFLGLRTTRIQHFTGKVKILSNRNINEVINYNVANSLAIVDVGINYESKEEKVEAVLQKVAEQLTNSLPKIKGPVKVLGINELGNSAVTYRLTVETVPMEHYTIQREMRKQIKIALDQAKIKIPYPQIEVHNGK